LQSILLSNKSIHPLWILVFESEIGTLEFGKAKDVLHLSTPFLEGISYSSINLEDARELEKEFCKEEVWKTINNLSKEKAPGPDGFNIFNITFFSIAGTLSREKLWAYL